MSFVFYTKSSNLYNAFYSAKVALKRQQAAEDAIALKMAKVATGHKLSRLPPGKIFGMAVTEPKSVVDGTKEASRTHAEDKPVPEDSKDCSSKDGGQDSLSVSIRGNCSTKRVELLLQFLIKCIISDQSIECFLIIAFLHWIYNFPVVSHIAINAPPLRFPVLVLHVTDNRR